MKKWIGQSEVTDGASIAAVCIMLEELPAGERRFGSTADVPHEQPFLAREAAALSGLRFASARWRHLMDGMNVCVESIVGDAESEGFSVAACLATWHALQEVPPPEFDQGKWKETDRTPNSSVRGIPRR